MPPASRWVDGFRRDGFNGNLMGFNTGWGNTSCSYLYMSTINHGMFHRIYRLSIGFKRSFIGFLWWFLWDSMEFQRKLWCFSWNLPEKNKDMNRIYPPVSSKMTSCKIPSRGLVRWENQLSTADFQSKESWACHTSTKLPGCVTNHPRCMSLLTIILQHCLILPKHLLSPYVTVGRRLQWKNR